MVQMTPKGPLNFERNSGGCRIAVQTSEKHCPSIRALDGTETCARVGRKCAATKKRTAGAKAMRAHRAQLSPYDKTVRSQIQLSIKRLVRDEMQSTNANKLQKSAQKGKRVRAATCGKFCRHLPLPSSPLPTQCPSVWVYETRTGRTYHWVVVDSAGEKKASKRRLGDVRVVPMTNAWSQ